jgi:transglutaminase-like putative cysteine protease
MAGSNSTPRAPSTRLLLLGAILSLAVVSAAAFGRVFIGPRPAMRLGLAAGISVLLAGLLERRNILLSTLVSAAGLAVAVGLLVFPETTKYALPTMRTLRAMRHAWAAVGRTADAEIAPALPLDPLFLAALTAVWTAAFSCHALAARARSPLLALLPPAALLAFGNKVLDDGARPLYVAVFLIAALAILFADSLRRVGQWGPISMWHGRYGLRTGRATTSRGARRVAAACLALALFAPGLLPGFRDEGLVDLHTGGVAGHISIDPLVDLRPALLSSSNVELFTVVSNRASYWRFITLDTFTGRLWTSSDLDGSKGAELAGTSLQLSPEISPDAGSSVQIQQRYHLERLTQIWLPAAADPIALRIGGEHVLHDPRNGALVVTDGTPPGLSYDITSLSPAPDPTSLDSSTPLSGPDAERYLQLPTDLPSEITDIAHKWSDGETTAYGKIRAIQNHLRTFRYDDQVPPGHGVNDILNFLTNTKAGYCEQFAGSMAVLLRAIGIPARVAVGFTTGSYDSGRGLYKVKTKDAHAWVEVPFPGRGWLAFEPTPLRYNPSAASYDFPPASGGGSGSNSDCVQQVARGQRNIDQCSPPAGGGGPAATPPGGPQEPTDVPTGSKGGSGRGLDWKGALVIALVALALALTIAIPTSKVVRRRMTLSRAKDPRRRVMAAYRVFTAQAADVGLGRDVSETPGEYRSRLEGSVRFSNGDLARLTALTDVAAYSDRPIDPREAYDAIAAARRTARDVRRHAGAVKLALGLFRLDRSTLLRWAAG